jgi:hypothetical protein
MDRGRQAQRHRSEHVSRSGEMVEDYPHCQQETQSRERGEVCGSRPAGDGRRLLKFEGDEPILAAAMLFR